MCGIYAQFLRGSLVDPVAASLRRDRLAHRGPDDAGIWMSADEHVLLAHRRLSIIDLSPTGHQPMLDSTNRLAITFNGDIYNYRELRAELERRGIRFRTQSDTEVILEAYRLWGADCVKRLIGMFAFVIYDRGSESLPPLLFLARDRIGEKPLYFRHTADFFEAGSELKALTGRPPLSVEALNAYLALGYVPSPLCLRSGVEKLPPAHTCTYDIRSGALSTARYWQIPSGEPARDRSEAELLARFEEKLQRAVDRCFVSDVPVGIFLSGGLDSSLVTAIAAKQRKTKILTFTLAVPDSPLDESSKALAVAKYLGTEHHVFNVNDIGLAGLADLIAFIDEPIADSSILPTYLISRHARSLVKVALGGDGGDEIVGGYAHYRRALELEYRARFGIGIVGPLLARLAERLPAGLRGRRHLVSLRGRPRDHIVWGTPYFDPILRERLLTPDALADLRDRQTPENRVLDLAMGGHDTLDGAMRRDLQSTLADGYLVKADRASMASGLELREPFLDSELVEFMYRDVPSSLKATRRQSRIIERRLAAKYLPAAIIEQRKQGFSIPVEDWFRAEKCESIRAVIDYLPDAIRRDEVNNLIDGQMRNRANGSRLFGLLMLGYAMRNWRDNGGESGYPASIQAGRSPRPAIH